MFYRILNQVGTFLSPRTSPFDLRSALWLDLLSGGNPGEGSFFVFSPDPENSHPSASGGRGRRRNFFCKLFGCKDFRGRILPLSIIRVRQSWDTEARVFVRRRNTFSRQAVAPLGGVLNDRSGAVLFAARRTTNREPPK